MLAERPCVLRDEDHKYVDLTTGTEMVTSVTSVINHFKSRIPARRSRLARHHVHDT